MSLRRPRSAAIVAVTAAVAALPLSGCSLKQEHETGREGQGLRVAGVTYNVYITRQLNPHDAEDSAYMAGENGDVPGYYFYGVFLTACNNNDHGPRLTPTTNFSIRDTQGDRFLPLSLPKTNIFAYRPKPLAKKSCVPSAGSIAATSPTAGALLVFKVPVIAVENRPLELEIEYEGETGTIVLDI